VLIAGTHSGAGKTTVTIGLIGALRRRGLTVQPFKVGPDFIDPLHHQRASGRPPRNLDGWMLTPEANRDRFARTTVDADVGVIEGVMGLFDGSDAKSDRGSAAEMAKLLGIPVVLVIDAGAMARSAAALIHGYNTFDPHLRLAGVIANRIGSESHAQMISDAVAGEVPILGALPRVGDLIVPERHLGLHLPHEAREDYVQRLSELVEQHIDLDLVLETAAIDRPAARPPAAISVAVPATPAEVRIGVARDEAFCFYYTDNLELLEQSGAELVEFSPLKDPVPPGLDGLYIGGGYPELHAAALAENAGTRETIRELAGSGTPIYAECGGLMYLAEALQLDADTYPMCGVFPFTTKMPAGLTLSYVEIETTGGPFGPGHHARGHVYHHSRIEREPPTACSYRVKTSRGEQYAEGYHAVNALASYAHLDFASAPSLPTSFVQTCRRVRGSRYSSDTSSTRR
jgi:cobyrinic acid a,c-diamide synthase